MERTKTYVLKFSRKGEVLDREIHQTLESAGTSAMNYAACFGTTLAYPQVEQLLIEWDEEEPLFWEDGEYEIMVDVQEARFEPREDNQCRIIQFRREVA